MREEESPQKSLADEAVSVSARPSCCERFGGARSVSESL